LILIQAARPHHRTAITQGLVFPIAPRNRAGVLNMYGITKISRRPDPKIGHRYIVCYIRQGRWQTKLICRCRQLEREIRIDINDIVPAVIVEHQLPDLIGTVDADRAVIQNFGIDAQISVATCIIGNVIEYGRRLVGQIDGLRSGDHFAGGIELVKIDLRTGRRDRRGVTNKDGGIGISNKSVRNNIGFWVAIFVPDKCSPPEDPVTVRVTAYPVIDEIISQSVKTVIPEMFFSSGNGGPGIGNQDVSGIAFVVIKNVELDGANGQRCNAACVVLCIGMMFDVVIEFTAGRLRGCQENGQQKGCELAHG